MAFRNLPAGRTAALASAVLVLGAAPAGAISQQIATADGCEHHADGRVACTFTAPTPSPIRIHVPAGVTSARMMVRGGAGGAGAVQMPEGEIGVSESPGGPGGTATATIPLRPGESLDVRVGGPGQSGPQGGDGGLGGGGSGCTLNFAGSNVIQGSGGGGGGGGGSEVRIGGSNPAGTDPLIAAGGGGGGGSGFFGAPDPIPHAGPGGAGGGRTGAAAPSMQTGNDIFGGGGSGGTSSAGGTVGGAKAPGLPPAMGNSGVRGQGGDAGMLAIPKMFETGTGGGGGGGGGYFGGAAGSVFAGGGGGSGFGPEGTTFGTAPTGANAPQNGEVVILFDAPRHGASSERVGDGAGAHQKAARRD
jgi:hypothetical protein